MGAATERRNKAERSAKARERAQKAAKERSGKAERTAKARERAQKAAQERSDKAERSAKARERAQKVATELRNKANERAAKQRERANKVAKERAWKNVKIRKCSNYTRDSWANCTAHPISWYTNCKGGGTSRPTWRRCGFMSAGGQYLCRRTYQACKWVRRRI